MFEAGAAETTKALTFNTPLIYIANESVAELYVAQTCLQLFAGTVPELVSLTIPFVETVILPPGIILKAYLREAPSVEPFEIIPLSVVDTLEGFTHASSVKLPVRFTVDEFGIEM